MTESRRPNEIKVGAVLSYAAIGVQLLVALVYTPVMLRLLGQAEYGLYSLVSSIVGYLGLLSFGFGGAYMRFYARYDASGDASMVARLNGLFAIVFSLLGLIAAAGGLVLVFNISGLLGSKFTEDEVGIGRTLMILLVVNLAASFTTQVFRSYIIAQERFIFQKSLQIASSLASPLLTLPLLLMGYGSIGMVAVSTSVTIASALYSVSFAVRRLGIRFDFRDPDFALLREIAIFSSFIFVNMVVDQINWNVDKYIIGRFRGPSEVAVYAVAASLRGIYVTFSTALYGLFVPRVNQMVSRSAGDHALTELLTRVGRIQFVLLAPIAAGFVFLGEPFVVMWAGGEYRVSYLIALIMILPNSILLIQNLAVEIQRAKNMHQFFSWVYLGMAIANISISIPLTYRYGALGAAVGTALAYILGHGLIMNWYYHRRVGLNMRIYWSGIARVGVALGPIILVGIAVRFAINLNEVGGWLLGGAIFALLSAASLWFVGMNVYEKKLFSAPVKKLLRRA